MTDRLPTSPTLMLCDEDMNWPVEKYITTGKTGQLIRAELNLHQMGLTSQVSAPENLANSGDQSAKHIACAL